MKTEKTGGLNSSFKMIKKRANSICQIWKEKMKNKNIDTAVILAAGKGERISNIDEFVAKPLIKINVKVCKQLWILKDKLDY